MTNAQSTDSSQISFTDLNTLKTAANQGDARAAYQLGNQYFTGEGVPKSRKRATEFWRRSADLGFVPAQIQIARQYAYGRMTHNFQKAKYYARLAANQEPKFKFILDNIEESECMAELTPLADRGDAQAQCELADIYDNGVYTLQNMRQAAHYYALAAAQGNADGQYRLGWHYYNGEGVSLDRHLAAHYYKLAAAQGDEGALFSLGCMYNEGVGVPYNVDRAIEYLTLADEHGSEFAAGMLKEVQEKKLAKIKAVKIDDTTL